MCSTAVARLLFFCAVTFHVFWTAEAFRSSRRRRRWLVCGFFLCISKSTHGDTTALWNFNQVFEFNLSWDNIRGISKLETKLHMEGLPSHVRSASQCGWCLPCGKSTHTCEDWGKVFDMVFFSEVCDIGVMYNIDWKIFSKWRLVFRMSYLFRFRSFSSGQNINVWDSYLQIDSWIHRSLRILYTTAKCLDYVLCYKNLLIWIILRIFYWNVLFVISLWDLILVILSGDTTHIIRYMHGKLMNIIVVIHTVDFYVLQLLKPNASFYISRLILRFDIRLTEHHWDQYSNLDI